MFDRATVTGGVTWAVSKDPIADMLKIKDEVWRQYSPEPPMLVLSRNQVRAIRRAAEQWGDVPVVTRWRIMKECDALLAEVKR